MTHPAKFNLDPLVLPMTAALLAALGLALLAVWERRRFVHLLGVYRGRYLHLVSVLEQTTGALNHIGILCRSVHDGKILDFLQRLLQRQELLLQHAKDLEPFGSDLREVDSASSLAFQVRRELLELKRQLGNHLEGKQVDLQELSLLLSEKLLPKGCYFCSRPYRKKWFTAVRVRLDGRVVEVDSCSVCRTELKHRKKIKVLYFMQNGRPIHWSAIENYNPKEEFWNINNPTRRWQERQLELVRPGSGVLSSKDDRI